MGTGLAESYCDALADGIGTGLSEAYRGALGGALGAGLAESYCDALADGIGTGLSEAYRGALGGALGAGLAESYCDALADGIGTGWSEAYRAALGGALGAGLAESYCDALADGIGTGWSEAYRAALGGALGAGLAESYCDALADGIGTGWSEAYRAALGGALGAGLAESYCDALADGIGTGWSEAYRAALGGALGAGLAESYCDALADGIGTGWSEAHRAALGGALGAGLAQSCRGTVAGVPGIRFPESCRDGLLEGPVSNLSEPDLVLTETFHTGVSPELPEVEHGVLTTRFVDAGGCAEVDLSFKSRDGREIGPSLEYMLHALNPAFAAQFRAWILRSEERGPDWLTQAAASLRKLMLGVLHTAAPNDLVLQWVTDPSTQLDRCGRPTRRTKVDWLCGSIRDERYRKFVRMELDSALAILDMLNRAIHVNEYPELEESFTAVSARVRFVIRHIVTLGQQRRAN